MGCDMWKSYQIKLILSILFLACLVVVVIFINTDEADSFLSINQIEHEMEEGKELTRMEAYRLLSFLDQDKIQEAREYTELLSVEPEQYLTCIELRDLMLVLFEAFDQDYFSFTKQLPDRLKTAKERDPVYITEFLEIYESFVALLEDTTIEEKQFFVWKVEIGEENNKGILIEENGIQYQFSESQDYSSWFQEGKELFGASFSFENCALQTVTAMVSKTDLIYLKKRTGEEALVQNVYVKQASEKAFDLCTSGLQLSLTSKKRIPNEIKDVIADLKIEDGQITEITLKQDKIRGKVLLVEEEQIEIQKYGKIPLAEQFQVYKVYGEIESEPTANILVGYATTEFIISDGKLCAALLTEPFNAETIRVVLNTTNYQSLYHDEVRFTADSDFIVEYGNKSKEYKKGEELVFQSGAKQLKKERLRVSVKEEKGKITILSIERGYGKPSYRGRLEIKQADQGLVLVNEVSMEEYLYSVVPSEMPLSHGEEALKVQAVCARSYAYNQLLANRYSRYGAHVDDSVNCQVYNNIQETDSTILAVKDTYGKVMKYQGRVVNAFYFSTSCGYTANVLDVWPGGNSDECFVGKLQTDEIMQPDLSEEQVFRDFIEKNQITYEDGKKRVTRELETYDEDSPWYRWRIDASLLELESVVDQTLKQCFDSNPKQVLTKTRDGSYQSISVGTVGKISSIRILERGESGIATCILIKGSEATVKLYTQTNIRTVLAPLNTKIKRHDGSTVSRFDLLPSAFFYIEPIEKEGNLIGFSFIGGGYGHGTGMSQHGVKSMVNQGKNYEEILNHYYTDITLDFIY